MDIPKDYTALQKPLEHFRANTKRLKIHPLELAALWIVGAHLVFLPWAIGGMRLWGQIPSLVLAVLGMIVALRPRNYTPEHTGSNSFRLITWPKLIRFPIFWFGLALFGYIVIQALNPAWEYRTDGKSWWMRKVAYIEWLPAGVEVPFARWGPWRMLMIYASAWLTVCTIWIAFTRRRTVQIFLSTLAVNGLLLAGLGLAQKMVPNGKMYWLWTIPRDAVIFSSFVYKNHGGAYLDLTLFITCGLAGWYYLRGLRRLEKSNPAGLFAFFATCIGVAVLVSYARGATLVMLVFLAVAVGAFVLHQLFSTSTHRKPVVAFVLILIFGYFLKSGLEALGSREAWSRLQRGVAETDGSIASRRLATTASMDMLKANWKFGHGAGSFRFLFPLYQQRYPEIYKLREQRMVWEHAHNDLVEIPAELGVPGVVIALLAFVWWMLVLVRNFFWQNPLSLSLVLGLFFLAAYSAWDFPFQCPAVLLLWCVLFTIAPMWTIFEEQNLKG